jgi:hypothetical protein
MINYRCNGDGEKHQSYKAKETHVVQNLGGMSHFNNRYQNPKQIDLNHRPFFQMHIGPEKFGKVRRISLQVELKGNDENRSEKYKGEDDSRDQHHE